jgi:hypothetical protein
MLGQKVPYFADEFEKSVKIKFLQFINKKSLEISDLDII